MNNRNILSIGLLLVTVGVIIFGFQLLVASEFFYKNIFPVTRAQTSLNSEIYLNQLELESRIRNSLSNYVTIIVFAVTLIITFLTVILSRLGSSIIDNQFTIERANINRDLKYIDLQTRALISRHVDEKLYLLDKMIEIKPSEYTPLIIKADILLSMNNMIDASKLYKKAITIAQKGKGKNVYTKRDVADAFAMFGLGLLLSARYTEAIKNYNYSLEYSNEVPQVYCSRAHAYLLLGKRNLAIKDYEYASQLSDPLNGNPHNFVYNISTGILLLLDKKSIEAENQFRKILNYNKNSFTAYIAIAYALRAQGKISNAAHYFKKAKRIRPLTK